MRRACVVAAKREACAPGSLGSSKNKCLSGQRTRHQAALDMLRSHSTRLHRDRSGILPETGKTALGQVCTTPPSTSLGTGPKVEFGGFRGHRNTWYPQATSWPHAQASVQCQHFNPSILEAEAYPEPLI